MKGTTQWTPGCSLFGFDLAVDGIERLDYERTASKKCMERAGLNQTSLFVNMSKFQYEVQISKFQFMQCSKFEVLLDAMSWSVLLNYTVCVFRLYRPKRARVGAMEPQQASDGAMESRRAKIQRHLEIVACEKLCLSCWMICISWWIDDDERLGIIYDLFLMFWVLCLTTLFIEGVLTEESNACACLHLQRLHVRPGEHQGNEQT